jgi:hypothetical protein
MQLYLSNNWGSGMRAPHSPILFEKIHANDKRVEAPQRGASTILHQIYWQGPELEQAATNADWKVSTF